MFGQPTRSISERARLWVVRLKNGLSVEQPIAGDELRAIKRYFATRTDGLPWLFISERGQPLTRQSVNYLVACAAARGRSPACLATHAASFVCGFYLANRGHDLQLIGGVQIDIGLVDRTAGGLRHGPAVLAV